MAIGATQTDHLCWVDLVQWAGFPSLE